MSDWLIESGSPKNMQVMRLPTNAPIPDGLVERGRLEHVGHVRDVVVSSGDVLVKGKLVLEGLRHIGHSGDAPVPYMPVGRDDGGLIGEPKIPGGEEVGIVERV